MQRSDQSTRRGQGLGFTQRFLITLIWIYRYTLSYFLGGRCRFYPTCSEYGVGAIDAHGSWRGLILIARRIGRCHPWHGGGWDPVPPWSGSRPESSVK